MNYLIKCSKCLPLVG